MSIINTNVITATCACGNTFETDEWLRNYALQCNQCESVTEAANERRRHDLAKEKKRKWITERVTEITPRRYRETDISHPSFNRELWKQVESWKPSADVPFLGLVGESGASKTRIGFLMLREIIESSIETNWVPDFDAVTSPELARIVASQFTSGGYMNLSGDSPQTEARNRLKYIRTCDFLMIDDLGKARHTPAVVAELFAIIDHRHAHNLKTIWTANSSPEQIVAGMPEDMAGPLAGRLVECSKIFNV